MKWKLIENCPHDKRVLLALINGEVVIGQIYNGTAFRLDDGRVTPSFLVSFYRPLPIAPEQLVIEHQSMEVANAPV